MKTLRTKVTLYFWAAYPDDDLEADAQADRISDALTQVVDEMPEVTYGTTQIEFFDTVAA